ncbi:MAG: hypothetical protein JW770_07885 [Actinobacteria bacterium]|nr:hypothetical protein [Actinomycetota bacterium]
MRTIQTPGIGNSNSVPVCQDLYGQIMNSLNKEVRSLILEVKKSSTTREQMECFVRTFIELMADSGISPRTRIEFYEYSKNPLIDKDKLINIAENTLLNMQ